VDERISVGMVYGSPDQDWMNSGHGEKFATQLKQKGIKTMLKTVPAAGHLVRPKGHCSADSDHKMMVNRISIT
jgi:hypothetical protein